MRLRWVAGWRTCALYALAAAAVLGLTPEAALAKAAGRALTYPTNSLNYPPIGAGVETMAPQSGGGYAIVLGNNCTPEILNCTTYAFPYGGDPV